MEITIVINKCNECDHSGHSGAFTPGGAIYVCNHKNSPEHGTYPGHKDFNDITTKEKAEIIHGPKKLNDNRSIPNWCPLKHGYQY